MKRARTASERVERAIAVLGAVALSLGLLLSDIPVPAPAEAVQAIPGCGDRSEGACIEEGRSLARSDLARGTARLYLFGEVLDIAETQRILSRYGIELVPVGGACCDPLLLGYNSAVLRDLDRRAPDLAETPFLFLGIMRSRD